MADTNPALLVYADSTFLIDLADPDEKRHTAANDVLKVFQTYPSELHLRASSWTYIEAFGVLYGHNLERKGIIPSARNPTKVRNILPPHTNELVAAKTSLDKLISDLQATTSFAILPEASIDPVRIWQLAIRFGEVAAIWPADSLHVAMALLAGCSIFISDDQDLADKIDFCSDTLIEPFLREEYSLVPEPMRFEVCGVDTLFKTLETDSRKKRRARAIQLLRRYGYR